MSLVRLGDVVHVAPLLRPHVAEEVRGDRRARADLVFAVFRAEAAPYIAVEIFVEGPHLLPEPLGVGLELLGRHVVAGAPHGPEIREPDLARALVAELDVALEFRPHRLRDRVPADPGLLELVPFPALREDVLELPDGLAFPLRGELRRAVFAFPVRALHPFGRLGELGALLRVARRGQAGGDLEEQELPREIVRQRDGVEARRPLDGAREVLHVGLVGLRGERVGVVGDVRLVHPPGALLRDPQAPEIDVDAVEERARLVDRRRRVARRRGRGDHRRGRGRGGRRGLGAGGERDGERGDDRQRRREALRHGRVYHGSRSRENGRVVACRSLGPASLHRRSAPALGALCPHRLQRVVGAGRRQPPGVEPVFERLQRRARQRVHGAGPAADVHRRSARRRHDLRPRHDDLARRRERVRRDERLHGLAADDGSHRVPRRLPRRPHGHGTRPARRDHGGARLHARHRGRPRRRDRHGARHGRRRADVRAVALRSDLRQGRHAHAEPRVRRGGLRHDRP